MQNQKLFMAFVGVDDVQDDDNSFHCHYKNQTQQSHQDLALCVVEFVVLQLIYLSFKKNQLVVLVRL